MDGRRRGEDEVKGGEFFSVVYAHLQIKCILWQGICAYVYKCVPICPIVSSVTSCSWNDLVYYNSCRYFINLGGSSGYLKVEKNLCALYTGRDLIIQWPSY